ncbi:DUF2530 domain-containing protein [Alloscardovia venturai]|uniref:DUF2530 domain-containing protein n=1 Tax=Alloscardovia venturai TaxID=1769421 RepID=A0ABW2Y5W2_9BIFI
MKIAPIFDPEQRKPAPHAEQVDLHVIFLVGTIVWLLAGVYCAFRFFTAGIHYHEMLVCAWGVAFGIAGLIWEIYHRQMYRLVALMQQN